MKKVEITKDKLTKMIYNDAVNDTLEALEGVVAALKDLGVTKVSLDELLVTYDKLKIKGE